MPWSSEEFEAKLRAKEARYHIHHPFNKRLNSGQLAPFQVRGWVANRFYYQLCIPIKDAAVMSNCPDRATRRRWLERMLDHDGKGDYQGANAGGIEIWSHLGKAVGLAHDDIWNQRYVLPWRALCCGCLRELRAAPALARRRDLLAHRNVCAQDS
jgi:pyrroloquinoline-quinone synthase